MLDLDDARGRLAAHTAPLSPATVPLPDARGCRLAAAAVTDTDLPPFDTSAMDGYAARSADLAAGAALPVAFEIPAGHLPPELPAGRVARIFTGAPMPAGADTVVPQEEAQPLADGRVQLAAVPTASHVRRAGEVALRGAEVARPGEPLTPQRLALLAACGCARVAVVPRPRVAILVTGTELIAVTDPPSPGKIRNSNGPLLAALAAEAGLEVVAAEGSGDERAELERRLAGLAGRADLVVATGGVSVGDYDLVPAALAGLGAKTVLHGVAMQPGKPLLAARLGSTWAVGLPGNPASVLVGWRMFVRPLAEALAGDGLAFGETPVAARLGTRAHNSGWRVQLRPATIARAGQVLEATVLSWHGSHDLVAAAAATALVRLAPGAVLEAGDEVGAYPMPWRW